MIDAVAVRRSVTCSKAGDGRKRSSECRLSRRKSAARTAFDNVQFAASEVRRFGSGVWWFDERGGPSKVGDVEHGEGSSRIEDQGSTRDTFVSREVRTPGAVIAANLSVAASLGEPQTPLERARTLVNPYERRTSLSVARFCEKSVRWSFAIRRNCPIHENLDRPPPSRLLANGRAEDKS